MIWLDDDETLIKGLQDGVVMGCEDAACIYREARMIRVIRELVKYINEIYDELGAIEPEYGELSSDAKELLK